MVSGLHSCLYAFMVLQDSWCDSLGHGDTYLLLALPMGLRLVHLPSVELDLVVVHFFSLFFDDHLDDLTFAHGLQFASELVLKVLLVAVV